MKNILPKVLSVFKKRLKLSMSRDKRQRFCSLPGAKPLYAYSMKNGIKVYNKTMSWEQCRALFQEDIQNG